MISISIVSHAQNALVNRLLTDLAIIEHQSEYEIVVTENIPDDIEITQDVAGKIVRCIKNTRPKSFACNHNKALVNAEGEYYCVLNPDVRWVQPVFPNLLSHCESGEAQIMAPMVVDFNGAPQDSFRQIPTPGDLFQRRVLRRGLHPLAFLPGEFVNPDWIAGIFMLMPSAVFREIGGFDERYRMYFEDVDFCARARLAGIRIGVDTRVVIQHEAHRSSRTSGKYFLWHVLSALRFFTSRVYRRIRNYSGDPIR